MKREEFQKKADEIMRDPAAYGFVECTLCGREQVAMVGLWFLEGEAAVVAKQPEGKQRVMFYAMCEECGQKGQESADAIETLFLKEMSEGKEIDILK